MGRTHRHNVQRVEQNRAYGLFDVDTVLIVQEGQERPDQVTLLLCARDAEKLSRLLDMVVGDAVRCAHKASGLCEIANDLRNIVVILSLEPHRLFRCPLFAFAPKRFHVPLELADGDWTFLDYGPRSFKGWLALGDPPERRLRRLLFPLPAVFGLDGLFERFQFNPTFPISTLQGVP